MQKESPWLGRNKVTEKKLGDMREIDRALVGHGLVFCPKLPKKNLVPLI